MPRLAVNIESHGELTIVDEDVEIALMHIGEDNEAEITTETDDTITVDYPRGHYLSPDITLALESELVRSCPQSRVRVELIEGWHSS